MIIILEGPDKCGKTTLAKKIVDEFGFEYYKCNQPKGDPYLEYMQLLKKIEKRGKHAVIDRFAYGELVYGPLYRGKSELSYVQLRNIELKALSLGAILIYCSDTAENINKRLKKEGDDFARPELTEKTLKLFEDVLSKRILFASRHQMKTKNDLTKSSKIKKIIDMDGTLYEGIKYLKTAIGNQVAPTMVLVGEQRNEKANSKYNAVGQPFDFGVSSEYLFDELKRAGTALHDVMFINSDSKELKYVWDKSPFIVALGRAAGKRLEALGIDYVPLTHPSYERRFNGKKHTLAKWFKDMNI